MTSLWRTLSVVGTVLTTACDVSIGAEDELGDRYAEAMLRSIPVMSDSVVVARMGLLGNRLVLVADDASRDWHFYVVDQPAVNAFAVPGGHIFVYRGLVETAGSWPELAGVLAHEVAHVTLRHGVDQLRARTRTNALVAIFCSVTGWCASTAAQVAINLGGNAVFASYSRRDEAQADSAAIDLLVAAGIDPRGVPAMFERLAALRDRDPTALEGWFASHPAEADRIERSRYRISRLAATDLDQLRRYDPAYDALRERLGATP